jgi:hypothetical protein
MSLYVTLSVMLAGLSVASCTSDPNAPINQSFPIRQMDHFFDPSATPPRSTLSAAPAPDYTRRPGYAPAYPAY